MSGRLRQIVCWRAEIMSRLSIGTGLCAVVLVALMSTAVPLESQSGAKPGEWRSYGADAANTRYSPLDQITAANFNSLEIAWRFKTDNLGPRPEFQFEGTPVMAGGVLYSTGGWRAGGGGVVGAARARRRGSSDKKS